MNQSRLIRVTSQKTIRDLIGSKPENTKKYFEPMRESDRFHDIKKKKLNEEILDTSSDAILQIPEHQRFYVWKETKQIPLIDSIMIDNPIPLMVFTEEVINGKIITFVQDGQQRLITIQKFMLGEFQWNNKNYGDFDEDERYNFLGYKITCEIIKNPTVEQISRIFERLNSGKPLTDNDKFWNRRTSPIVSFALDELINHVELKSYFKKYVGKVAEGKTRSQLSDMIGAVVSIAEDSYICIRNSFDRIGVFVCKTISEEVKQKVVEIFKLYFTLIDAGIQKSGNTKPKKIYLKLTGMLGIYLYWSLHPAYYLAQSKSQALLNKSLDCWSWFASKIQEKTFKYEYFVTLPQGAQRNVDVDALKQRTSFLMNNYNSVAEEEFIIIHKTPHAHTGQIVDSDNESDSDDSM
jgi:hypothetical protein